MTTDRHQVFAVLDPHPLRHEIIRVGASGSWASTQALWMQLDNARLEGRLPGVQYLVVRSTDDPDDRWRYARSARHGEVVMLVGWKPSGNPGGVRIRNNYADREAAARAYARWSGRYRGMGGGWIYNVTGSRPRPIIQGWWAFATMLRNTGRIIERDGRWYVVEPQVTVTMGVAA